MAVGGGTTTRMDASVVVPALYDLIGEQRAKDLVLPIRFGFLLSTYYLLC